MESSGETLENSDKEVPGTSRKTHREVLRITFGMVEPSHWFPPSDKEHSAINALEDKHAPLTGGSQHLASSLAPTQPAQSMGKQSHRLRRPQAAIATRENLRL